MSDHPELLKQLAQEVVDGILLETVEIYTDGNEGETGSGVLIELPDHIINIQRRNADHASVFRTEVVPPVHPWYFQRYPGSAISFKVSRSYQTTFLRISTDHLRCMNFEGLEVIYTTLGISRTVVQIRIVLRTVTNSLQDRQKDRTEGQVVRGQFCVRALPTLQLSYLSTVVRCTTQSYVWIMSDLWLVCHDFEQLKQAS
ncbi:RNase H domain-containing protein [Trichonephila clavipes]|nr:RNase H domain-containing protein [Trichonephila clavipes]